MGEKQGHKISAPRRSGLGTTSGDTVGRYVEIPHEHSEHSPNNALADALSRAKKSQPERE
jgi:hypothetical protein